MTEAPLAGPLSPIALAIGAAAATAVIIIGVVAGPGTMACVQRGDFAACMSETFLGGGSTQVAEREPAQETAALAEAPAESEPEAEIAEAEAAGADETAMSVSQAVMPSFALVRVEPDGSAVIAGTATPSGEVRIFADETEIGTEMAEPSGDFAFVTDQPLPTGGVELRVLDVETDTYASTSVVVVVQDDRTGEPLVVASEPGQASEILQGLESPAPAVEIAEPESEAPVEAVAEVEPEAPVETVAEAEPEVQAEITPEAEPETVEAVAEAEPAEIAEAEEPMAIAEARIEPATPVEETPATVAPAAEAPPPAEPAAETPAAETAAAVAEPALDVPAPQVETPAPAEIASNDVAPDAPAPQEPAAPVEVTEPETPELPADDPTPAVESETPPEAPAVEAPVAEQPVAASAPAAEEVPAQVEQPAQSETPVEAAAPVAVAIVQPTIDAVEIDGDRNFFAGAGTDGMTIRLYVDNDLVGTTEVVDGRWLVETIGELDQASQRVRIDMIGRDGAVAGRAEVDFVLELPQAVEDEIAVAEAPEPETPAPAPAEQPEPVQEAAPSEPAVQQAPEPVAVDEPEPVANEVPTMVGVTEGNRTTSGMAIIRRGDNLWTIARRVYGEGIRYTQIFEANADQIRDPDLIYPGQVFDLPDTDQVIGGEAEEATAEQ